MGAGEIRIKDKSALKLRLSLGLALAELGKILSEFDIKIFTVLGIFLCI